MRGGAWVLAMGLAAALAASPVAAQHALYSDAEIASVRERGKRLIELVVTEDIPSALPREKRPGTAGIGVDFPVRGEHPLAFYSDPKQRRVIVPIESALFIDDLATVQAWFDARGCVPAYIIVYLAALLGDRQPLPAPLEAFAIDRDTALADPVVNDLSAEISTGMLHFLVAHEVGHLVLGHAAGQAGGAAQAQEMAADAFALDYFAGRGLPPIAVVGYFFAAQWLDPTGAAAGAGSHPVTPGRVRAIADRLAAEPDAFIGSFDDPASGAAVVAGAATELAKIADMLATEGLATDLLLAHRQGFPLSRLATACPS